MRDPEMRLALRDHLERAHESEQGTLIRDELGLCLGETRVDVAVVNGAISGYEIKSEHDRLDRLPRQVELYGRVLDYAYIVTGERFADRVTDHVPSWWGVLLVSDDGDGRRVHDVRTAARNEPDAYSVAQLLWRDEAYEALVVRKLADGLRRATRFRLWERLAGSVELADLQEEVRERLKARREWPAAR